MWLKARLSGRKGSTMPLLFSERCSCAFSGLTCSPSSTVRDGLHLMCVAKLHIPIKWPLNAMPWMSLEKAAAMPCCDSASVRPVAQKPCQRALQNI